MLYKLSKRLIDIIIAGFVLLALSPLFILVTIALLCTGEHEVLYKQERIGYKNMRFNIWKFATMLKNSLNIGTGSITLRNDPRVTPFGKILRITKINELPQIINVLRGDMSIVGPRPLLMQSFELYADMVQKRIYNQKPGITGIGSLVFRDEEKILSNAKDVNNMLRIIYAYKGALEMWYQDHASLYTDFKIMFLTATSILLPKNTLVPRIFKDLPARIEF